MSYLTELYQLYRRYPLVTTDSRNVPADSLFVALRGERFDGNAYAAAALEAGAARAVVSDPTLARELGDRAFLVDDGLVALTALANHHRRQLRLPVLAITGSNGKTTTKELIASVMRQRYRIYATEGNYNNHIGVPLSLLRIGPGVEMAIIEMGANHQREIAALCRIAEPTHGLITNIGEAHLEGFGGIEGVRIGKGELYDHLRATDGVAFVNLDADFLPEMAGQSLRRINFRTASSAAGLTSEVAIQLASEQPNVSVAFADENGKIITANTHLPGRHNFENIKAAVAVGSYFKVSGADIKAGLENYHPDNNRSQRKTIRGVDFWLDAYNANPSSTRAAIDAFFRSRPESPVLVLGEMLELGHAAELAHWRVARHAVANDRVRVVLVGPGYTATARKMELPHFMDVESLKAWFWEQDWTGATVLLKGSRRVGLERLLA